MYTYLCLYTLNCTDQTYCTTFYTTRLRLQQYSYVCHLIYTTPVPVCVHHTQAHTRHTHHTRSRHSVLRCCLLAETRKNVNFAPLKRGIGFKLSYSYSPPNHPSPPIPHTPHMRLAIDISTHTAHSTSTVASTEASVRSLCT